MQGQSLLSHQKSQGLEVPLLGIHCPLVSSVSIFCYQANLAQKGPGALLKAMRRSTSFIGGTRRPIAPNSGGCGWRENRHSNEIWSICGS